MEENIDDLLNSGKFEFDVIDTNERRNCKGRAGCFIDKERDRIEFYIGYSFTQYILNETTLIWQPLNEMQAIEDDSEEEEKLYYKTEGIVKISSISTVGFTVYEDEPGLYYLEFVAAGVKHPFFRFNEELWQKIGYRLYKRLEEICF